MRKSGIITKGNDEIMPVTWAENVLVNKETPLTEVLIEAPQRAEIGQILAVKSVDKNGKPTEWEVIKNASGISDYDELDNQPSINGVTLSGDKSADDLGLLTEEQYKGTVTSINVGSASYTPASGVVSIPSYPTSLPANGGTAANVSGTVAISHGGTGATSASSARTNLGLGTAAVKGVDTSITPSTASTNLPTSAAVASVLTNVLAESTSSGNLAFTGVIGSDGWIDNTSYINAYYKPYTKQVIIDVYLKISKKINASTLGTKAKTLFSLPSGFPIPTASVRFNQITSNYTVMISKNSSNQIGAFTLVSGEVASASEVYGRLEYTVI